MLVSRWIAIAGATAALTGAMAVNALGDHGGGDNQGGGDGGHNRASQLDGGLVPSMTTDPTFHGVMPGGHDWTLRRSQLELRGSRIEIRVRGLLFTGQTNPGPVTAISAEVFCGADSDMTPAATTRQAPLSSSGNGRIRDRVTLPARCLAPIVLINPTISPSTTPDRSHYIATLGLGG